MIKLAEPPAFNTRSKELQQYFASCAAYSDSEAQRVYTGAQRRKKQKGILKKPNPHYETNRSVSESELDSSSPLTSSPKENPPEDNPEDRLVQELVEVLISPPDEIPPLPASPEVPALPVIPTPPPLPAPQPPLEPPAPAAGMAGPEGEEPAITQDEKTGRCKVTGELRDARQILEKNAARASWRRVADGLKNAKAEITVLQSLAYFRISNYKDEVKQNLGYDHWAYWKGIQLDEHEELEAMLAAKDGTGQASQTAMDSHKDLIKQKITNHETQITNLTNQLKDEINRISDTDEIPAYIYTEYTNRAAIIREMIRPQLGQVYEELMKFDPNITTESSDALNTKVLRLEKALDEVIKNLYKKKFPASMSLGGPGASSTPNNSFILGQVSQQQSNTGGHKQYNYPRTELPVFTGDYLKFPKWRKEMERDVCLPHHSDDYCLRMISELSPEKDLQDLVLTKEEGWAYMHDKYANPAKVSKRVIQQFVNEKSIEGPTDQAKLVNLYKRFRKCYLTLHIVGQEKRMTNEHSMLTHTIDIIPGKYSEEFTDRLDEEVEKLEKDDNALTPKETYDLLDRWLKRKATKLENNHPELLVKKKTTPPATVPEDKTKKGGRGGNGGNGGTGTRANGVDTGTVEDPPQLTAAAFGTGTAPTPSQPRQSSRTGATLNDVPDQFKDAVKKVWTDNGKCPCCGAEGHIFQGKKSWGGSTSLADCPKFINEMTVEQRAELLMAKGWCYKCLSWKHSGKDCKKEISRWFCHVKTKGKVCAKAHSNWLHGCKTKLNFLRLDHVPGGQLMVPADAEQNELMNLLNRDVMLPIVEFWITDRISTLILLDGGSTNSMITFRLANHLRLKAFKIRQQVTLATREPEIMDMSYYGIVLELEDGPRLCVFLGVERITSSPGRFSVEPAYEIFPHVEPGSLDKKSGQVEILIGQDNAVLLPGGGLGRDQVADLRVFSIPFGPGVVLTGHHPDIRFVNPVRDDNSKVWNTAKYQPVQGEMAINLFNAPSFYEAEMLAYSLPPLCNNCKACPICTVKPGNTVKETQELQLMRKNIWHNADDNTITVSYPIVGDLSKFKDNRSQAIARATSTMKSLKNKGMLSQYNGCVRDYIDRGVWKKISVVDIEKYKAKGGTVAYVAHHGVAKPDSLTTKLRIVVDSSLKNCWTGPRLSSLYAKGPNYINDLYDTLLKWRELMESGVFDVKKAYHSMKTTEKENMMRLVVWKEETGLDWDTFMHTVVGMGDVPASVFLELAKEIAADKCKSYDPLLAKQIKEMAYVDDALFGGTKTDVNRMRGKVVKKDGKVSFHGTIERALATVGMSTKNICCSGDTDPDIISKQGKVLGLQWNPTPDTISFRLSVNFSAKVGAGRTGPDLTEKDLEIIKGMKFTKRICLQAAAQNFDPLGLITAYSVKFKLGLKELVALEYGWDDILSDDLQEKWRTLLCEALQLPELVFPRSVSHKLKVSRPEVIAYADGSTIAFGAVIYIRFRLDSGAESPYHTALLTSKSRVTPKHGLTPPRSELQGLIIAVRVVDRIISALDTRPLRVTVITDSQCSVAALDVNASSLATFFANRALEISNTMKSWGPSHPDAKKELTDQELAELLKNTVTHVDLLQHTPGLSNPADWPTRGQLGWQNMGPGTVWQDGQPYLRQDRSHWLLSRDFVTQIPLEERRKKFMESEAQVNLAAFQHIPEAERSSQFMMPALLKDDEINWITISYVKSVNIDPKLLPELMFMVKNRLHYTNKWIFARNVIARLIRFWRVRSSHKETGNVPSHPFYQNLSRKDISQAEWLAQLTAMPQLVAETKDKKNLESLCIFWQHGVARTRGRLSREAMNSSTGFDSLVVIPYRSRLAYLLMEHAHCEDHRAGGDTLMRTRRLGYWIVRGRKLADKVVRDCNYCKHRRAKTEQQQMAELPKAITDVPCRAFTNICIDYSGGVSVRGVVNSRAHKICYPLVIICMNTGAVHLQLSQGYSTEDFLVQFEEFCAIRGTPALVRTDMGSQLVAAGRPGIVTKKNPAAPPHDQPGDLPCFPWEEIRKTGSCNGIEFQHCATQAQWRNGRAERAVAALKNTLHHLTRHPKGRDLNYPEMRTLLSKAAAIINRRPIGVRHHGGAEGEVCVITPALLLQGGRVCTGALHDNDLCQDMAPHARMALVEQNFLHWWKEWFQQVWESLIPVKKWRTEQRNLQPGDIVLLKYSAKLSKPSYRYGKVLQAFKDENGLVRDAMVATRSRRIREKPGEYKPGPMDHQLVPVQRLVLLLPKEEYDNLPTETPGLHLCEEELIVSGSLLHSSPPPSPTAPPTQCAPDLNHSEDHEVVKLNTFLSFAINNVVVDIEEPYYCMECGLKEAIIYGDKYRN